MRNRKFGIEHVHAQKYVVIYIRVSNEKQDLELQIKMGNQFKKKYEEEGYEVLIFKDHGKSAMKLPIHQRKGLSDFLMLVRQGAVKTLLVYERTRLARWFFEYCIIAKILIEHKVEVVFTIGNHYEPFSSDYSAECVQAGRVHGESYNLYSRLIDKNYYNPSSKYGYIKCKDDDGNNLFDPDPVQSEIIKEMFNDATSVANKDEFTQLVKKYKSITEKSAKDIIRYIKDSFYTSYLFFGKNERREKESNITPIISVEQYDEAMKKVGPYITEFEQAVEKRIKYNFINPKCSECNEYMKLEYSGLEDYGRYICNRKVHKNIKVIIDQDRYNTMLIIAMKTILVKMLSSENEKLSSREINKYFAENKVVLNKLKKLEQDLSRNIALEVDQKKLDKKMEELLSLKVKIENVHAVLTQIEKAKLMLKQFKEKINLQNLNYLADLELLLDAHLLIKDIFLTPENNMKMDVYFNWLLQENEVINI
ncbi:recombinase family protein [Gottfriedia acidiceleris]|uniref:recombinase family protein n=1 Tax=Gottfriedia acidiceleris TaxID=371036 RepID=UPI003D240346